MTNPAGAQGLGRYVLEARIARGGMGEVFRAAAIGADGFRKPVVIKRVRLAHTGPHASRELSDMFVAEAKLMTRLAHPNIVEVFDFGKSEDGAYYLVMELVDGLDLRAFADNFGTAQAMPIPIALFVVREALRGLAFAHTQALGSDKLVHRDISPGNILLSTLGEVKLADFGVALVAAPDSAAGDSLIVGKPSYMAPEQAAGDAIDARADLFSLGVVLYELVAGRLPFSEDALARRRHAMPAEPRALSLDRKDAPPALEALLQKALSHAPHARFEDARAMLRAMDALRGEGLHPASPDDLADAVSERCRTRKVEQVIVIGRDIAERTRVERGDGGTSFTLSVEEPSARHHTERLTDDEAQPRDREPSAVVPSTAKPRRGRALLIGAALAIASTAILLVATRKEAREPPVDQAAPAATSSERAQTPSAPAASDLPPTSAVVAPSSSVRAPTLPPRIGSAMTLPTASSPTPAVSGCTGTIKIMASHGWAVRGGPSAAEAPGVYSWRCGSYNLSATSRLDDQKRAASVVIREDKQAVVDLR